MDGSRMQPISVFPYTQSTGSAAHYGVPIIYCIAIGVVQDKK
jgi:hypothetical protein